MQYVLPIITSTIDVVYVPHLSGNMIRTEILIVNTNSTHNVQ